MKYIQIVHFFLGKLQLPILILFLSVLYFNTYENIKASDYKAQNLLNNNNAIIFTENKGQIVDRNGKIRNDVLFTAKDGLRNYFFTRSGVSIVEYSSKTVPDFSRDIFSSVKMKQGTINFKEQDSNDYVPVLTKMSFLNSNQNSEISNDIETGGYSNFYYPHCPNGILNVKSFKKIIYHNIYEGIDFVFTGSGNQNSMAFDFIVKPGAKHDAIKIQFDGFSQITQSQDGSLILKDNTGNISSMKTTTNNLKDDKNQQILAFTNPKIELNNNIVSISLSNPSETTPLIVSSNLDWATFFGGSRGDHSSSVVVDQINDIIISGYTLSLNLPISSDAYQKNNNGDYDCFISKYDILGNRLWSTYFGGSQTDYAYGVCTDKDAKIYVAGWTWSRDFPVTPFCYQPTFGGGENDGFIFKFDNTGRREWATYCGGNVNDHIYGISYSMTGTLALTGWTSSSNFPVSPQAYQKVKKGSEDAFLISFTTDCGYRWSTFLGGDSTDAAQSVFYDVQDNILISGYTKSWNFPVTFNALQRISGGLFDAFFAKFDNTGSLLYSTFYGGSDNDFGTSVTSDFNANIIVCGYTNSNDLQITSNAYQRRNNGKNDAFIIKINNNYIIQWTTYFGGTNDDLCNSINCDIDGNILFAGQTYSSNFPVKSQIFNKGKSGITDAFAVRMTPDGQNLFWSTYYGGPLNDWGYGITSDAFKSVYVTGDSEGDESITTNNSDQPKLGGAIDAFLFKRCPTVPEPVIIIKGDTMICEGDLVELDAGEGYRSYLWSTGETTQNIIVSTEGDYTVQVIDNNSCVGSSNKVHIKVLPLPQITIIGEREFCENDSSILDAGSGYAAYYWSTGETTRFINVKKGGVYVVTVTGKNGCIIKDSAEIIVRKSPAPLLRGLRTVCAFSQFVQYSVFGEPGYLYKWTVHGGTFEIGKEESNILATWGPGGIGSVVIEEIDQITGCVGYDSISILITDKLSPKITSNKNGIFNICEGDSITLNAGGGYFKYLWSNGDTTQTINVKSAGKYFIYVKDQSKCEGRDTVSVTVNQNPNPVILGDSIICLPLIGVPYNTKSQPGHIYKWKISGGSIVSGDNTDSITVDWLDNGNGTLDLTDIDTLTGCSGAARQLIVQLKSLPKPKITFSGKLEFCEGDSVILDAGNGYLSYLWSNGSNTEKIVVYTSGKYSITVKNALGCKGNDTLEVIVHPKPAIPQITEKGDTLFSSAEFAYQWKKDGIDIVGDTNVFIVPTASGNYSVVVTTQFGCSSISKEFRKIIWKGEASVSIEIPDTIFANTGEVVNIPLIITASNNLNNAGADTFSAYLKYDRSLLVPISKKTNVSISGIMETFQINGRRTIETGIIAEEKFYAVLGDAPCTVLYLDSVNWNGVTPVKTTLKNGVFCIKNLCQAGGTRLYQSNGTLFLNQNRPNPYSDNTEIEFGIIEHGQTRLYISDVIGRKLATLFDKDAEPGRYTVNFSNEDLPTGIYFYILVTPNQVLTGKLLKN